MCYFTSNSNCKIGSFEHNKRHPQKTTCRPGQHPVLSNKRNIVHVSPNPEPRSCICVVKTLPDLINDTILENPQ